MKRLMSLMLGLTMVLGTVSLFADTPAAGTANAAKSAKPATKTAAKKTVKKTAKKAAKKKTATPAPAKS